jgi:hypothetical protein
MTTAKLGQWFLLIRIRTAIGKGRLRSSVSPFSVGVPQCAPRRPTSAYVPLFHTTTTTTPASDRTYCFANLRCARVQLRRATPKQLRRAYHPSLVPNATYNGKRSTTTLHFHTTRNTTVCYSPVPRVQPLLSLPTTLTPTTTRYHHTSLHHSSSTILPFFRHLPLYPPPWLRNLYMRGASVSPLPPIPTPILSTTLQIGRPFPSLRSDQRDLQSKPRNVRDDDQRTRRAHIQLRGVLYFLPIGFSLSETARHGRGQNPFYCPPSGGSFSEPRIAAGYPNLRPPTTAQMVTCWLVTSGTQLKTIVDLFLLLPHSTCRPLPKLRSLERCCLSRVTKAAFVHGWRQSRPVLSSTPPMCDIEPPGVPNPHRQ